MPFPKNKIHINKSFGSCQREITITDPETGVEIPKIEDCNKPLPESKYFEIQNQIAAGVTLNEVNTNIINNNNGINIAEFENAIETAVKKSKSKTQNNEVNNENI